MVGFNRAQRCCGNRARIRSRLLVRLLEAQSPWSSLLARYARILTIASEKCTRDSVRARVLCLGCTRYTSGPPRYQPGTSQENSDPPRDIGSPLAGRAGQTPTPRESDTGVTGTHKGALHPALTPAKIQVETLRNGPSVKCPSACNACNALDCANNPMKLPQGAQGVGRITKIPSSSVPTEPRCLRKLTTHARAERTEMQRCGCTYPTLILDPASLCPALPLRCLNACASSSV